jgi:hypothetical protein
VNDPEWLSRVVDRGMHVSQRLEDLADDVERRPELDRHTACGDACDQVRTRQPVDVFEGHVELAVVLTEIENLNQIRMAKRGLDPRFVAEHRDQPRIGNELRQDAF